MTGLFLAGVLAMSSMTAALAEDETETETAEAVTEAEEETETEEAAETEEETATEEAAETEEETETEEAAETEEETEEAESETEEVFEPRPTYTALDYVELGDYIGLEVDVNAFTVTEDDVDTEAEALIRDSEDLWESVDTVRTGDEVNIDYVGTLDGEEFEGGSAEGYSLEIGSGTFIDGFEDGLIGAHTGDTLDLDLTFPEDYFSEDLAGQDVVFTVTVNEILQAPELTDETVEEYTSGAYTDVESFKDYIRSALQAEADYYTEYYTQQDILAALEDCSTITGYPEDLIQYTIDEFVDVYGEDYLEAYGYSDEDSLRELAESYVEPELLLQAVAETEDMTLTDEEYQEGLELYAENYGYDTAEEFEEAYIGIYGEETLYDSIMDDKVMKFLEENAVINIVE